MYLFTFTSAFVFIHLCKYINIHHISEHLGQNKISCRSSVSVPHKYFPVLSLHPTVLICNRALGLCHVQCLFQQKFLQLYESSGTTITRGRMSKYPFPVTFLQGSTSGRTGGKKRARCPPSSFSDSAKPTI